MRTPRLKTLKHFFVPRSLRYQLLSRSLLVLAALFLLIGVLQYIIMKDFVYENKAEALSAQIMSMPADWFKDPNSTNGPDSRQETNKNKTSLDNDVSPANPDNRPQKMHPNGPFLYQPGLTLAFINPQGEVTDLSKNDEGSLPLLTTVQYNQIYSTLLERRSIKYKIMDNDKGKEQLVVYRLAGSPNRPEGVIQASIETDSLNQLLLTQLAIFTALSIAALGAGLALYLPLLRRTLTPLSRVVTAALQTDAGNLTTRLPVQQGQQEIDRLSEAFNGMLERLDASFDAERNTTERMRRFVADASHELRTPMTSIHGFLEVLLRGAANNPEQLHRALNSMQMESKRINKLVEDLLLLTKLDQEPQLLLTETCLDEIMLEIEPQLHILAGNRTVHLTLPQHSVIGQYHADKLKQVLLNLFLNAVQHTDSEAGIITITLDVKGNNAILTVEDNGAGIQAEHLPKLFERFYRSESSRTRKNGGAGLGLAISKSIIDAHNGTIEIESIPGKSTVFRILLPVDAAK